MQFSEFLSQSAEEINLELQGFLSAWYKDSIHTSPRLQPMMEAFIQSTEGGKRIRGALVILGHALVSKVPDPELLKVAAAYELFQTAILIHDDIIDKSPTRRGKPSLHMTLGGEHYGTSQAMCLGDIGFFLAYKLIAESQFDVKYKVQATAFFSKSIIETVVGEMLDVDIAHSSDSVTFEETLEVSRLKTAYYTFVAPLTLGAILAGAEESVLSTLKVYGENIGIAFQLQDDIRDSFGSEETLGKQPGGDICEGKQTVLYLKARERAAKNQLEILKDFYGKRNASDEEIEKVKKVFRDTEALQYAQDLVQDYSKKARTVIPEMILEEHLQIMLGEIIDYVSK